HTGDPAHAGSDERLFREHSSIPFRMAVEHGGARAVQVIGGKSAGLPLGAQSLVSDVVVTEWGMDGIVSSDCRAARQLVGAGKPHHSLELALAASIDAGVTQFADEVPKELELALEKKLIQVSDIDRALRKNLRIMLRLGLLDPEERVPYSSIGRGTREPWLRPEHQDSVRRVTQKSIVLLKNQPLLLPLNAGTLRQVAIIGPLADRVLCDWHSGTLPYAVTPVDGLRERLGFERVILTSSNDPSEAICAAKAAEVAIVCVGTHPTLDNPWAKTARTSFAKELPDRPSLQLEDEELVKLVVAANPKTVLVLISSGPCAIDWSQTHVPAILHLSHNSQELGRALADVLFGDYNPAGRLVHTWPSSVMGLAPLNESDPREGRTYQYAKGTPLYPFGFGLSYTRFAYSRLLTSSLVITDQAPITVSCDVTNIGRVPGDEVVQLYARYLKPSVPRPQKWLVGFQRVEIPPGATRTITLELRPESLMLWDSQQHRFVLEAGPIELQVGRSSAQIELICNINAQDHPSLPAPGAAATKRPSQGSSKQPV
ncbi:MAG TPA: glycoside hydrolase family 3 C-terminal domain-containing protein, partial [Polyangiaceae bacterium]|nr:glycoside hydrolase family 3 C-terminal domain-containing protein [Polyangiaceae bacterium]